MGEKIVVGQIDGGFRTDRLPEVIDNDSFPTLINAYQWRGRVRRKRGTALLGRLQRTVSVSLTDVTGNLLVPLGITTTAGITPGTVSIIGQGSHTWKDVDAFGNITYGVLNSDFGTFGTINYLTGAFSGPILPLLAGSFSYYPALPVMGLEDLVLTNIENPGTLGFDTTYSYNISATSPYTIYDVSYFKNPATATYPSYVAKSAHTPLTWNGQNYQQFWTTNYQGALWSTNGIQIPFNTSNIGMQFAGGSSSNVITLGSNTATTLTVTITNCPLVIGDFVFANEWTLNAGLNFQTGYVTACSPNTPTPATKTITITFPNATIGVIANPVGILQYLTNNSNTLIDCIRWYDGDPTTNAGIMGWVNFMPPLSQGTYSIADLPAAQYYLVGARMIVPFKDRILFFGPVVQSSTGIPLYLEDTVIYSQDGTPYYTASYTNFPSATMDTPTSAGITFNPILVPINQTATSPAYFEDQIGFGGFLSAGVQQPITTVSINEDALIVGFYNSLQTRFLYTGNDLQPFNFFIINAELGSSSTFSAVTMDQGVVSRGPRGFIMTSQTTCNRIDLDILDQVFEIQNINNGPERLCAQRDFINEWIYFTYPSNNFSESGYQGIFPNQTLQFNYRDNTWAVFNESFTTYGIFRRVTGDTWSTIGQTYPTWSAWNTPWDAGDSTLLQPQVIGGNAQGFVILRDEGTGEGVSLYIQNIDSTSTVTSPNHSLSQGDYIMISGCLGTIGTLVNGQIFSVSNPTQNTFVLNPTVGTGTYTGGGLITRLFYPQIMTKQFPTAWGLGRKTRIGPQQYYFTTTQNSQITLMIFLSQQENASLLTTGLSGYNSGHIVPESNVANNALVYSSILYTCPESTNLGLTPANINLNMLTAQNQSRTWHRMNTSLIGDTVQIGFTMSDSQMRTLINGSPVYQTAEIELCGFVLDVNPSMMLS